MPSSQKNVVEFTFDGNVYQMRSMPIAAAELWLGHAEALAAAVRVFDAWSPTVQASRHDNVESPDGDHVITTTEMLEISPDLYRAQALRRDANAGELAKLLKDQSILRTLVAVLCHCCPQMAGPVDFTTDGDLKPESLFREMRDTDMAFLRTAIPAFLRANFNLSSEEADDLVGAGKKMLRRSKTEATSDEASSTPEPTSSESDIPTVASSAPPLPTSPS